MIKAFDRFFQTLGQNPSEVQKAFKEQKTTKKE